MSFTAFLPPVLEKKKKVVVDLTLDDETRVVVEHLENKTPKLPTAQAPRTFRALGDVLQLLPPPKKPKKEYDLFIQALEDSPEVRAFERWWATQEELYSSEDTRSDFDIALDICANELDTAIQAERKGDGELSPLELHLLLLMRQSQSLAVQLPAQYRLAAGMSKPTIQKVLKPHAAVLIPKFRSQRNEDKNEMCLSCTLGALLQRSAEGISHAGLAANVLSTHVGTSKLLNYHFWEVFLNLLASINGFHAAAFKFEARNPKELAVELETKIKPGSGYLVMCASLRTFAHAGAIFKHEQETVVFNPGASTQSQNLKRLSMASIKEICSISKYPPPGENWDLWIWELRPAKTVRNISV